MRTLVLVIGLLAVPIRFATATVDLSMSSFRQAAESANKEKRLAVLQENLKALKAKIDELEKPEKVDLDRVDLIILKNMYEPIVELASRSPDAIPCAVATHELEIYTHGDGEPSATVTDGKALIALICPNSR